MKIVPTKAENEMVIQRGLSFPGQEKEIAKVRFTFQVVMESKMPPRHSQELSKLLQFSMRSSQN